MSKRKPQLDEMLSEFLSLDEIEAGLPPWSGEREYTKAELMQHGIDPETARNGFECVGDRRVKVGPCVRIAKCYIKRRKK